MLCEVPSRDDVHRLGYLDGRPSPTGLPGWTTFTSWYTDTNTDTYTDAGKDTHKCTHKHTHKLQQHT
eukprot:10223495-Karenia_brevis.AAC.1